MDGHMKLEFSDGKIINSEFKNIPIKIINNISQCLRQVPSESKPSNVPNNDLINSTITFPPKSTNVLYTPAVGTSGINDEIKSNRLRKMQNGRTENRKLRRHEIENNDKFIVITKSQFDNARNTIKNKIIRIAIKNSCPTNHDKTISTKITFIAENMIKMNKYHCIEHLIDEKNKYFQFDGQHYRDTTT